MSTGEAKPRKVYTCKVCGKPMSGKRTCFFHIDLTTLYIYRFWTNTVPWEEVLPGQLPVDQWLAEAKAEATAARGNQPNS